MLHSAFCLPSSRSFFFFFNDPATPEISPLPLHAALPISRHGRAPKPGFLDRDAPGSQPRRGQGRRADDEPEALGRDRDAERHVEERRGAVTPVPPADGPQTGAPTSVARGAARLTLPRDVPRLAKGGGAAR